tara:strand:- start:335 stop:871 length:537 start_codon:yes stop_codon:yes gene_type:complete
MKERTKEDRAAWLRQTLIDRGYSEHRLASEIMHRLDVSRGKADMWLRGGVGGGELSLKFATVFDFVPGTWIWEDYDPHKYLGPNRLKIAENLKSDLDLGKENELTEKTLRTLLKFISDKYLPPDLKATDEEWQENVVKAFFIFNKTLKAGLSPKDILEMGTAIAELENPLEEVAGGEK